MWILHIACIQWLWDKRIDRQKRDLLNSKLFAGEILEFGRRLNTDFKDIRE